MTAPIQWDGTAEGATPIIDMILRRGGTARYHDASDRPGETTCIAVDSSSGASWRLLPGEWLRPSPDATPPKPQHDTARQVVLNEVQWVALVSWLRSHGWVPVRMPDVEGDLPTYVVHPSPEVLDSGR